MKKKSSGKKTTGHSSLNRLGTMIGSKPQKTATKHHSDRNTDAVLDMIDQRISGLLVRSSEIETKLDDLEGKPSRPVFDLSARRNQRTYAEKQRRNVRESAQIETVEISELVKTIQGLTQEVQTMKEEQRKMSDKINEMHTILVQAHEE